MERKLEQYYAELSALGIEQDEYGRILAMARETPTDEDHITGYLVDEYVRQSRGGR